MSESHAAPDNDLVISDSRVSRYHAQVTYEPDGPHIRDLGSTNGTHLDGRPVSHERLSPGDQVSIGGFGILVQADASARAR
jgi:ABC transport system ATP-binding/permease protein